MGAASLFAIMAALCANAEVAAQAPATIVEASNPAPLTPTPEANTPDLAEILSDAAELTSGSTESDAGSVEVESGSAEVDWELEELQRLIEQAHFRVARRLAESTRQHLESLPAGGSDSQRASLGVLSATVELALGQPTAALEHMRAALRADLELHLETTTTSPKVVAVLEAARSELESRPHEPAESEEE